MRDANGRATGITGVAGRNTLFDAAGFLDAPNGGKANLPMDVIVASQKVMLRDLAKAGLTASGGQCLWEDLYRQFQREGTASMRFFCQRTAHGGGRGAGAQEKMIAQLPTLRYHDGDEWMDNANYGERFPGGGGGDVIAPGPEPIAAPEAWDAWGRFALAVAKAGIPAQLHTVTEIAIGEQLTQLEKISKEVDLRPLRWSFMHMEGVTPAADRAHEEAQHVHRPQHPADRVRRAAPPDPGRQGLRDAADAGDPGQRHHVGVRHGRLRGQSVPSVPDACTSR